MTGAATAVLAASPAAVTLAMFLLRRHGRLLSG